MKVDVLLGLQWGDEGKGKIVDFLADRYKMVARFQGGPNAGHTLKIGGKKFVLHTVPSGIFREDLINLVGNGVVLDPVTFARELSNLDEVGVEYHKRLFISKKAHLILPTHRLLDLVSETSKGKEKIGSTLKGIGPTYMDKTGRNGIRVGDVLLDNFREIYDVLKNKHLGLAGHSNTKVDFDLEGQEKAFFECLEVLKQLPLVDGEYLIHETLKSGHRVLAEGAQGSMLDIDFGTYPFVTSSNTITAGVCSGLGIAPSSVGEVIGISKAYTTRVGGGPFPTEQENEHGEFLRKEGAEFGSTTGRPRRCGWLDLPQLKYTCMLNGVTKLIITKADVLNKFDKIPVAVAYHYDGKEQTTLPYDLCRVPVEAIYENMEGWNTDLEMIGYDELPLALQKYTEFISNYLDVPVMAISTGPEREKLVVNPEEMAWA
jgi:adenylosuccinate synthase